MVRLSRICRAGCPHPAVNIRECIDRRRVDVGIDPYKV